MSPATSTPTRPRSRSVRVRSAVAIVSLLAMALSACGGAETSSEETSGASANSVAVSDDVLPPTDEPAATAPPAPAVASDTMATTDPVSSTDPEAVPTSPPVISAPAPSIVTTTTTTTSSTTTSSTSTTPTSTSAPVETDVTFPAALRGTWRETTGMTVTAEQCVVSGFDGVDNLGLVLDVGASGFTLFEAGGRLLEVHDRSESRLDATFDTTYVEPTQDRLVFELSGDGSLIVTWGGAGANAPVRYVRCP